jgi:hypothetical protein
MVRHRDVQTRAVYNANESASIVYVDALTITRGARRLRLDWAAVSGVTPATDLEHRSIGLVIEKAARRFGDRGVVLKEHAVSGVRIY